MDLPTNCLLKHVIEGMDRSGGKTS